MDAARVDSLAREIIVQYGLPFELVGVEAKNGGWQIVVRDQMRRVVQFTIPDTTAVRLREMIKAHLDEET
jgi:hypothetical protein